MLILDFTPLYDYNNIRYFVFMQYSENNNCGIFVIFAYLSHIGYGVPKLKGRILWQALHSELYLK